MVLRCVGKFKTNRIQTGNIFERETVGCSSNWGTSHAFTLTSHRETGNRQTGTGQSQSQSQSQSQEQSPAAFQVEAVQ